MTMLLMLAVATLAVAGLSWYRRRMRASASGQRVCPHCGYDLRRVDIPRCPECGRAFGFDKTFRQLGIREDEVIRHTRARRAELDQLPEDQKWWLDPAPEADEGENETP
jgi:predicted amidophosphoribosyltransferase